VIIMGTPERKFQAFVEFLIAFVHDLNEMSREGAVVFVEGKRDAAALAELGYRGRVLTAASLTSGSAPPRRAKLVVILTDLDTEGRRLAARYTKLFSHMGVHSTLVARRRLSSGSRGKFLHIENLRRFAPLPVVEDSIPRASDHRLLGGRWIQE